MFVAASALAIVSALLQSPTGPPAASGSLPVQFVLRNAAMKKHALVANNELTISAGSSEPYLSSMKLGDFEASGEIAMSSGGADATLLLYATVDEDARAHRRIQISLPVVAESGWQSMTVTSLNNHVRVSMSGRLVAERDVEGDAFGLFGFEVARGSLSLRRWRVVRRDPYWNPLPTTTTQDVIDTARPPRNAQPPRLRHEVKPQYTADAMRHKIEGTVEVDGSVGPVHVTRSLDEDLDRQAVKAVKQWRFEAASVDGAPVPCRISVELSFVLRGR